MYENSYKNTGQIIKLMYEALARGQKSGNDLLMRGPPTQEGQTKGIEQIDLWQVAVQLSSEAKETVYENRRQKNKRNNNKKQ